MKPITLKTGKLAAVHDPRTIRFAEILRAPKKLPTSYYVDTKFPGCDPHMYLNDTFGDCTLAMQAEIQDRLVLEETGKPANIKDAEVEKQYFKETGGQDTGLNLLDVFKWWNRYGWIAGGKLRKLGGFVSVDWHNIDEVKAAIMAYRGLGVGVQLPEDAMSQFVHHKPWAKTKHAPDPNEGHAIVCVGWNKNTFRWITWSAYQDSSADWLEECVDEMYNPFDNIKKLDPRMIDVGHLRSRLAKVA